MYRDTFLAANESQTLGRRGFDIHRRLADAQILRNMAPHLAHVLIESRGLRNHRHINIASGPASLIKLRHDRTQQDPTVCVFKGVVGIGKVRTNIAKSCRTQQRVADRMQDHVAV